MAQIRKAVSLEIDQFNLDNEWIEQPVKYAKFASHLADARLAYDESKRQLELVKAELDRDVRSNPASFGLEKITEPQVTSCIVRQEEYQDAVKAMNKARHEMDLVDAYVTSLDHRKTALVKLVDLFLASYFSRPRASGGAKESAEDWEKRSVRTARDRKKSE